MGKKLSFLTDNATKSRNSYSPYFPMSYLLALALNVSLGISALLLASRWISRGKLILQI